VFCACNQNNAIECKAETLPFSLQDLTKHPTRAAPVLNEASTNAQAKIPDANSLDIVRLGMSEFQQPLKRQRVSSAVEADSDGGEDLGSNSAGSSQDEADGAEGDEGNDDAFRANDMIDLIFIEPDEKEYLVAVPQYTHQFFDVENHLEEVTFMEAPDECRVSIYVRCSDYKQLIGVPAASSGREQQQLLGCLKKAIPADAEVFLLHGNNNGEDDEEEEEKDRKYFERVEAFAVEPPVPFLSPVPAPAATDAASASAAAVTDPSQGSKLSRGIGKHLHTFEQGNDVFEIYIATAKDAGAQELLQRAECLALWYIETADSVDFQDERWQVLFLYRRCRNYRNAAGRKVKGEVLSIAGYFTLFTFHNPFAGSKMRVCQALILPHLQGRGLGRELLLCTYRLAREQPNVTELTVEDPAPGFQSLRDAVDLEWMYSHWAEPKPQAATSPVLKTEDVSIAAGKLKLTPAQVEYLSEAEQYACLKLQAEALGGADSEAGKVFLDTNMKPLRLQVKRRLLRQQPDVKALPKAQMQSELEARYTEQQQRFERSCKARARLLKI